MSCYFALTTHKINKPDKIIIYNYGVQNEISKSNKDFNTIFKLTNKRFKMKLTEVKDVINNNIIEEYKRQGVCIEFIYNNKQEMNSTKRDNFNTFQYNKLFFPVVNDHDGTAKGSIVNCFQYGDKENYMDSSRAELKYSKKLIKLVKNIK